MANNILRQFSTNYKQIIIDEIALEGLEGIGIDLLWRRIEKRLSTELTEKMRARYWTFIASNNKLAFYELPEPFPRLDIIDRFSLVDEATGHLLEPEDYLDGPYEYSPIENEYGSCRYYNSRKCIKNIESISYENVVLQYGDRLAIVASLEERWQALAPHMPMTYLYQMQPINYCLLELIGKSRENGQMSVGKSNLHKTINDSKTLFYIRKQLQDVDLIKLQNVTQVVDNRGVKCLLISLKRFYRPGVLCVPKKGMIRNVIDYLMELPNQCERTDVLVKKMIFTQKQNRKLQKTINVFSFEDRLVPSEISKNKKKNKKPMQKRKYICLSAKHDEVSESEEETIESPLTCQYKVGIGLMRQAYEQFLDAGLKGLTQVQLSHLLGIEFYTARAICRIFRLRNIVREYLEDKGKQRTARFIAVVATEKMEKSYEEQKNQFSEFIKNSKNEEEKVTEEISETSISDETPRKKMKMDEESPQLKPKDDVSDTVLTPDVGITEIRVLDGFEKAKSLGNFRKNPTLRQLKFANGILKVLNEKLCVPGYMTLSNLASKEVNEPPMDTKALKSFIQKLITDGHIKMYKIKWPGLQRYSVLICAHHVQISDPIITAKYKEISMRAAFSTKSNTKKEVTEDHATPTELRPTYPRYMKIRKLHEFIMNIAYFDFVKPESHALPRGFICVFDLFPEAKIEFLLNNLCTSTAAELYPLLTDSQLKMKLKDATPAMYKTLIKFKKVQSSITSNLKVLGMLGLVQLVTHQTAGSGHFSSFLFYVNRHAKILDTSGAWPRNIADVKEISYYFETANDVEKYWTDVYNISINTEIIFKERNKKQLLPPLRTANDVQLYDNGARFGDGFGPCGFDSGFFMEIPRFWHTYFTKLDRTLMPKKKRTFKKPKFEPVKKPKRKPRCRRPKKRVIERPPPREVPLKRRRPNGSVKWSKEEDLILTMCKAAITIMSPSSQPGSLIVRNIVAKDLLSIKDPRKTKGLCHSRAVTIESNITMIHEKQCILNEMRRRRNLIQNYEGLLKKLRLKYSTNMSKFINKARIPMMELIWLIIKVRQSRSYTQRMPCVAINLEDFHAHFTITYSTANKLCNMYKISANSPLREAIIVTVMQNLDSELDAKTARKMYNILQQYPESALRATVDQLRKCAAIAAKEKLFNSRFRKLDLQDLTQSSYKISVFYSRKWICRLNSDFAEKLAKILDNVDFENGINGSAEMNCAVCELESCNLIEIESTTVPLIVDNKGNPIGSAEVSALLIDTNYILKTGRIRLCKKTDMSIPKLYRCTDLNTYIEQFSRTGILYKSDIREIKPNKNNKLISYLMQKRDKGATFTELQDFLGYDDKTLLNNLQKLESDKIIIRVGFYENIIILTEYIKKWATDIVDKYLICTPWMKFTADIRIDVFLKWANVIINTIFEKPGCSLSFIADKFEFITCRAVQDICMFLEKNQCLTLKVVQITQPDLFSDEDSEPKFLDFNPFYAPEHILAYPTKNCVTKYCYLKKTIINCYYLADVKYETN